MMKDAWGLGMATCKIGSCSKISVTGDVVIWVNLNLFYGLGRTIWAGIPPRVNWSHVHRRRYRLLNCLICVAGEWTPSFVALATAACVHGATRDAEHEDKAPDEDVRPVACYQTLEVLLLLGSRHRGVRLLRRGKEGIRGGTRRVCTVHADLHKVGKRGGTVG